MDIEVGNKGSCGVTSLVTDAPATLVWKDLRVASKASKGGSEHVILNNLSGVVEPCHMLAIMGPSGCGKTTLLDTLAGRVHKNLSVSGKVLLNGRESNLSYGVSAYVTQDAVLMGVLTVRETLLYTALLRLPSKCPRAEKEQRVDEVITEMGLVDAKDTQIGNWYLKGVSGGQRKRVTIGCELITQPTLMFLDEPTSGLDAAAAYYVMETVRRLSEKNRTILTVIHQPASEVFVLFDQLVLLSNGNTIYFGSASAALDHFASAGLPCPSHRSPTDHFLHVVNQDFKGDVKHTESVERNINTLLSMYDSHVRPDLEKRVEVLSSSAGAPYLGQVNQTAPWYQTLVLIRRNLVNNWRNVGVFWVRLIMYLMLCVCIGTIALRLGMTWADGYVRVTVLFFLGSFLTFMSISGFPSFVEDMQIFIRERLNGYYSVGSFVVSNSLASVPFIFAIAFLSSAVVYWLIGLNSSDDRFPYFFINLFASLLAVESLMMVIAAVVPHYLMGIAAGAGILGMFMMVSGFFQRGDAIPAPFWRYPIHFIAYHSYALAGFIRNEFDNTSGWGCPCEAQMGGCGPQYTPDNPCTMDGGTVRSFYSTGAIASLNKWWDVLIQLGMTFLYRTIFWALLVFKERSSH